MITHRELDGTWTECPAPSSCCLKFHFPDMTPEEMAEMPLPALWSLMEAIDPPQRVDENGKYWVESGNIHRDYDLPAVINSAGTQWWQNGNPSRPAGGPSLIRPDGSVGRDSKGRPVL